MGWEGEHGFGDIAEMLQDCGKEDDLVRPQELTNLLARAVRARRKKHWDELEALLMEINRRFPDAPCRNSNTYYTSMGVVSRTGLEILTCLRRNDGAHDANSTMTIEQVLSVYNHIAEGLSDDRALVFGLSATRILPVLSNCGIWVIERPLSNPLTFMDHEDLSTASFLAGKAAVERYFYVRSWKIDWRHSIQVTDPEYPKLRTFLVPLLSNPDYFAYGFQISDEIEGLVIKRLLVDPRVLKALRVGYFLPEPVGVADKIFDGIYYVSKEKIVQGKLTEKVIVSSPDLFEWAHPEWIKNWVRPDSLAQVKPQIASGLRLVIIQQDTTYLATKDFLWNKETGLGRPIGPEFWKAFEELPFLKPPSEEKAPQ